MKISQLRKRVLQAGVAVPAIALLGAGFSAPAYAQDDEAEAAAAAAEETAEADGTITVTGSRIRRPNLESTVPITSIGGDTFLQQSTSNIGDTLNELPQLRSTFAQSNPGLGIGIGGLNLLDLRGLGTQRTLVLVNGRRHVAADILNNAVSPDVNTIPNDLIERVDIVTGGNSAIYGSDAIAGVVNFVLRRDFEGFQIRALGGVAEEGYAGNQYVSAMYGHNFADGRANVTLHGEYSNQERVLTEDVPYLRSQDNFVVIDADTALPNGSDGFPDRAFFRDIRSSTIHYNSLTPINQRNAPNAGLCGNATANTNGAPNTAGPAFSCTYIYNDAGRLVQQTANTRVGTGINPVIIGGNGQTGRERGVFSVLPEMERFNFNLLSHYEFSDAFELFFEGKWNRVNALGNNAGPSFNQGTGAIGDNINLATGRERVRLDNPFLNPADRATIAALLLASGCRSDLGTTCANNPVSATNPLGGNLTVADIAAINDGSYRFVVSRNLIDVGLRDEDFQRDTFRVVGGFRGNFWDDWNYEVSMNYGKFEETIVTDGFVDRQRYMLANDAGRNPITNQIQCRSQFDPAAAIPIQRGGTADLAIAAQNAARLAADIAACVPYNPFGSPDNSASIAYFGRTFFNESSLEQFVANAFVGGDTSEWFELPGGPIGFVLGAEYRKEKAFYDQDDITTSAFTNGVSIPTFDADFDVKEAFAEIRIPILRDLPFAEELTLSGAARVADYGGGTGTVWAYNAGIDWAPVRDVRFRGNYSRAVRAPNVSETGFPLVPNFAPGFADPCSPANRNQGNRAANCLADIGAPALALLDNSTPSLAIVSGSNPNLTAETSDSWTLGAVIQPRWLPGLSLSVDYYDITVDDVIVTLTAAQIVNACYDSANINNVFCDAFDRNRGTTANSQGDLPGRIIGNSLIAAPLNFASREREGIDFNLSYRDNVTDDITFLANLIYTHNFKISNYQDQINPDFENRILGEVGDPGDEFRFDMDIGYQQFTFGYRLRFIGPMYVAPAVEDVIAVPGACTATTCPPNNADYADILQYPEVFYHDIRFEWDVTPDGDGPDLNFYVGVDNVMNTHPPFGLTGTGAGNAIYDFMGRSYYAGVRARF